MHRLYLVDMLPEECVEITGLVFAYLKRPFDDYTGQDQIRGEILDILNKYKTEALTYE